MVIKNDKDFRTAYKILEKSFIPAELKDQETLYTQWNNGEVILEYITIDNVITGVITLWEFPDFIFAENFAVKTDFRNRGIGAELLQNIIDKYSDKRIVLEVEPPEKDIQKRRIRFYERNGFILSPFGYIQPPLRENCEDVPLLLMHTGNPLRENEFINIKREIFRTVYKCKNIAG